MVTGSNYSPFLGSFKPPECWFYAGGLTRPFCKRCLGGTNLPKHKQCLGGNSINDVLSVRIYHHPNDRLPLPNRLIDTLSLLGNRTRPISDFTIEVNGGLFFTLIIENANARLLHQTQSAQ
jgi:hypothetical protein